MIQFAIDGAEQGPGYVLIATVTLKDATMPALFSGTLPDSRAIALQARQLADAAALLLESLPEHERAFEALHDAIDELPTESAG